MYVTLHFSTNPFNSLTHPSNAPCKNPPYIHRTTYAKHPFCISQFRTSVRFSSPSPTSAISCTLSAINSIRGSVPDAAKSGAHAILPTGRFASGGSHCVTTKWTSVSRGDDEFMRTCKVNRVPFCRTGLGESVAVPEGDVAGSVGWWRMVTHGQKVFHEGQVEVSRRVCQTVWTETVVEVVAEM